MLVEELKVRTEAYLEKIEQIIGNNSIRFASSVLWSLKNQRAVPADGYPFDALNYTFVFPARISGFIRDLVKTYSREALRRPVWKVIIGAYRTGKTQLKEFLVAYLRHRGHITILLNLSGDIVSSIQDSLRKDANFSSLISINPEVNAVFMRLNEISMKIRIAKSIEEKRMYLTEYINEFINLINIITSSDNFTLVSIHVDELDLVDSKNRLKWETLTNLFTSLWNLIKRKMIVLLYASENDLLDLIAQDPRMERIRPLLMDRIPIDYSMDALRIRDLGSRLLGLALTLVKEEVLREAIIDIFSEYVEFKSIEFANVFPTGVIVSNIAGFIEFLLRITKLGQQGKEILMEAGAGSNLSEEEVFEREFLEFFGGISVNTFIDLLGEKRRLRAVISPNKNFQNIGLGQIRLLKNDNTLFGSLPIIIMRDTELDNFTKKVLNKQIKGTFLLLGIGANPSVCRELEEKFRSIDIQKIGDLEFRKPVKIVTLPIKLVKLLHLLKKSYDAQKIDSENYETLRNYVVTLLNLEEILKDLITEYILWYRAKVHNLGSKIDKIKDKEIQKEHQNYAEYVIDEFSKIITKLIISSVAKGRKRIKKRDMLDIIRIQLKGKKIELEESKINIMIQHAFSILSSRKLIGGSGWKAKSSHNAWIIIKKNKQISGMSYDALFNLVKLGFADQKVLFY
ncbi:MAG: hypothetical protein ACTSVW_02795 [Candidatus Njordarchaeales archaeon]